MCGGSARAAAQHGQFGGRFRTARARRPLSGSLHPSQPHSHHPMKTHTDEPKAERSSPSHRGNQPPFAKHRWRTSPRGGGPWGVRNGWIAQRPHCARHAPYSCLRLAPNQQTTQPSAQDGSRSSMGCTNQWYGTVRHSGGWSRTLHQRRGVHKTPHRAGKTEVGGASGHRNLPRRRKIQENMRERSPTLGANTCHCRPCV